jgi:hypothetical protein
LAIRGLAAFMIFTLYFIYIYKLSGVNVEVVTVKLIRELPTQRTSPSEGAAMEDKREAVNQFEVSRKLGIRTSFEECGPDYSKQYRCTYRLGALDSISDWHTSKASANIQAANDFWEALNRTGYLRTLIKSWTLASILMICSADMAVQDGQKSSELRS